MAIKITEGKEAVVPAKTYDKVYLDNIVINAHQDRKKTSIVVDMSVYAENSGIDEFAPRHLQRQLIVESLEEEVADMPPELVGAIMQARGALIAAIEALAKFREII